METVAIVLVTLTSPGITTERGLKLTFGTSTSTQIDHSMSFRILKKRLGFDHPPPNNRGRRPTPPVSPSRISVEDYAGVENAFQNNLGHPSN